MKKDHEYYFEKAAEQARQAECFRAKCGSVIASKNGKIIGAGYNAPAGNDEGQRYCNGELDLTVRPKYDKTCCVHAEWNAINDALKKSGSQIDGGTLYFMRVDDDGGWTDAGEPYCTVCSRLAEQSGLDNFALWVDGQPKIYDVVSYNIESYKVYLHSPIHQ